MHVDETSDCRSACVGDATCVAFETLPPNGDKNQNNCLLKNAIGSPQTSTGVTSFIKLGHTNQCAANSGSNDWDIFTKRDTLEYANATAFDVAQPIDVSTINPHAVSRALAVRQPFPGVLDPERQGPRDCR